MLQQDLLGFCICSVQERPYLFVNCISRFFTEIPLNHPASENRQKRIGFLGAVNKPERLAHAVKTNHLSGNRGCMFEIVFCPGGNFVENNFFGSSTSEHDLDFVDEFGTTHQVLIILGQLEGIAEGCATTRNDTDLANDVGVFAISRNQRVAGFMIGNTALILGSHAAALALWTGHHLLYRVFQIFLPNGSAPVPGGEQCGFVDHIGQIRTRKSRRLLRNLAEVGIRRYRLTSAVNLENSLSSSEIRRIYNNLPIEPPRSQQSSIQYIGSVRCREHDNSDIGIKAI